MPKVKNKIKKKRNNYFCLAIGIFIVLLIILIIGRVGQTKYLGLCIAVIFGDYSILILLFFLVYAIFTLILNNKFDFYHIYFIALIFIYLGLSLLSHLNIYDNMESGNILAFSFKLYSSYFKSYSYKYSTGGGVIGAVLAFLASFLANRIGIILLGVSFIFVGVAYLFDVRIVKLFKGGKLRKQFKAILNKSSNYFSNIKMPTYPKSNVSPSILKDSVDRPSFILQDEINKELLLNLKEYIRSNKLYCTCDIYYTSYTSSRFLIKLGYKNEELTRGIKEFFNRRCFIILDGLEMSVEIANSFKKLLAIKSILDNVKLNNIPLALDVNNEIIASDFTIGNLIAVVGDYTSGVKTFIRSLLVSFAFSGLSSNDIYLYDLFKEYEQIEGCINYYSNERDFLNSLDDGFSEYEKRNETLKYLDCDNIIEANKKINELDKGLSIINPRLYIISLNSKVLDEASYTKITYLIKFGKRVGFNIILIARDTQTLARINIQNSNIIAFYLSNISDSIKLFGSDIASRLQKKGDVLIQANSKIRHGQAPYISLEDFINVFKRL